MKKQDIVVHIKDEAMLNEAREILGSAGDKIHERLFVISLDQEGSPSKSNYLKFYSFQNDWSLGGKSHHTEITLPQLKELLNKYPCDKCDEACYYHCTQGGIQKPECLKK